MADAPEKIWLTPQFAEAAAAIGGGVYHVDLSPEDQKGCSPYVRQDIADAQVREAWDAAINAVRGVQMAADDKIKIFNALQLARRAAESKESDG